MNLNTALIVEDVLNMNYQYNVVPQPAPPAKGELSIPLTVEDYQDILTHKELEIRLWAENKQPLKITVWVNA